MHHVMRSPIRYSQQIQRSLYRQSLCFSRQILRHSYRLQNLRPPPRHQQHILSEMPLLHTQLDRASRTMLLFKCGEVAISGKLYFW
ncbi:uncharacterized protein DS421_11g332800 [Arachis hypogaea]|nr:uncharacterized protein DS421_11g332800 [Arachis hypogaea]